MLMPNMVKDEATIRAEIKNHIASEGGAYSNWYVGIAKSARERLFEDHKVKEKEDSWIFRKSESDKIARRIEDYFVNTLKTDGNPGGGDENTVFVYAYKKQSHTDP